MNTSHFTKNVRINYNSVRSAVCLLALILVYILVYKWDGKTNEFNLIVMISSIGLVGYNIYSSILREVNEGTWPYVVTSHLSPLEIVFGQLIGSSPTLLATGLITFVIQIFLWPVSTSILMFGYAIFILMVFASEGFRQAIKWEQSVSSGKSGSRLESQITFVVALVAAFSFFIFYNFVNHIPNRIPEITWYHIKFSTPIFTMVSLAFFIFLSFVGGYRNVQQAMKIQLSCGFWFISGWCIVLFLLGFTFVPLEQLTAALSRRFMIPGFFIKENLAAIDISLVYLRLVFVYNCWLIFLFVSLVSNPVSAAKLRSLKFYFKKRDWKKFLIASPASFVNFATLFTTLFLLYISHLLLPEMDMIKDFSNNLMAITIVGTLTLIRDSLVLWIFARIFKRKYMLVFCIYLLSFWFIIPTLLQSALGFESFVVKLFWPNESSVFTFGLTGIVIVLLEALLVLFIFLRLQKKISGGLAEH